MSSSLSLFLSLFVRESQELQSHQRRYLLPQNHQSHTFITSQTQREELKPSFPLRASPPPSHSSPEIPSDHEESQSSSSKDQSSTDQYELIQSRARSISQRIYDRYNSTPSH